MKPLYVSFRIIPPIDSGPNGSLGNFPTISPSRNPRERQCCVNVWLYIIGRKSLNGPSVTQRPSPTVIGRLRSPSPPKPVLLDQIELLEMLCQSSSQFQYLVLSEPHTWWGLRWDWSWVSANGGYERDGAFESTMLFQCFLPCI